MEKVWKRKVLIGSEEGKSIHFCSFLHQFVWNRDFSGPRAAAEPLYTFRYRGKKVRFFNIWRFKWSSAGTIRILSIEESSIILLSENGLPTNVVCRIFFSQHKKHVISIFSSNRIFTSISIINLYYNFRTIFRNWVMVVYRIRYTFILPSRGTPVRHGHLDI